jgi:hypothetical protein
MMYFSTRSAYTDWESNVAMSASVRERLGFVGTHPMKFLTTATRSDVGLIGLTQTSQNYL